MTRIDPFCPDDRQTDFMKASAPSAQQRSHAAEFTELREHLKPMVINSFQELELMDGPRTQH